MLKSIIEDCVRDILCGEQGPSEKQVSGKFRIVVMQRGFVVVGRVHQSGVYIQIKNAQCVRKWGTTKGLGELAEKGPMADTTLDPQATTHVHELTVVQQIDCNESNWSL